MPDPFSTLPAPLPLMILEGIEDLSTLNYLLNSSPAANFIFERYYCEISEAVLSNFVPQLQQLLRTILLTRSNRLSIREEIDSPQHLEDFLQTYALNNSNVTKPLTNATVSLSAVRSLIKSASGVQQASASFFKTFLDRVNSIKPSYVLEKPYNEWRNNGVTPMEGCPYEPLKCDNPSWIEEQRVYRALWRLQLYFDLVTITRPGTGNASQVWDLLKSEGPYHVWSVLENLHELDEINCVYEFLCEFSDAKTKAFTQPPHLTKVPTFEPNLVALPKSTPYGDLESSRWDQTPSHLERCSPGIFEFLRFSWYQKEPFKRFWRLGFCIWDREKMTRLGLVRAPAFIEEPEPSWLEAVRRGSSSFDYWFRWNSLVIKMQDRNCIIPS